MITKDREITRVPTIEYNDMMDLRSDDPGAMARLTGLEPATPGVTGRYSNQLSYNPASPPGIART